MIPNRIRLLLPRESQANNRTISHLTVVDLSQTPSWQYHKNGTAKGISVSPNPNNFYPKIEN